MVLPQYLVSPNGCRIRVVEEVADRPEVAGTSVVRRRNGRCQDLGKIGEPACRDLIARERQAGQWVDDRGRDARKVAVQQRLRGHRREESTPLSRAQAFVPAEHEHFVGHNRSPGRKSVLVPLERRLRRGKVVLRVESVVARELVGRSAEAVRPRFRDDRDDRLPLTIFSRERIPEKTHFLHRVERRVQRQVVEAQRPDVDTIDRVIGRTVTAPFDGHVLVTTAAGSAELRASIECLRRNAGGERGERQHAATIQRQILDHLFRDDLTDCRALRLQQRRLASHRDLLGHVANPQRQRRPNRFAVAEYQILDFGGCEALQLDSYGVGGRTKPGHGEATLAICHDDALSSGSDLRHRHGGAGQRCLCGIGHHTDDGRRCRFLGTGAGGERDERRESEPHEPAQHAVPPRSKRTGSTRRRNWPRGCGRGCRASPGGGQNVSVRETIFGGSKQELPVEAASKSWRSGALTSEERKAIRRAGGLACDPMLRALQRRSLHDGARSTTGARRGNRTRTRSRHQCRHRPGSRRSSNCLVTQRSSSTCRCSKAPCPRRHRRHRAPPVPGPPAAPAVQWTARTRRR